METKQSYGKKGEKWAAQFLEKQGYKILAINYRTPWGELDLVLEKDKTIVFAEVKRRGSDRFGEPEEAVVGWKRRHIARAALAFLQSARLENKMIRFDVISVSPAGLRHIPDAFDVGDEFYY